MQSQSYLIKSPARSILEYCPITFYQNCYSIMALQINSVMIDYRFQK